MHRQVSVKLAHLNSNITCALCKGYLIDASTITECLHSFCKTCIVRYIRRKESCPICNIEIMKDKIGLFLKKDGNLQYIVYKLVPGLFKSEMQRRRTLYETHPKALKYKKKKADLLDKEALGELNEDHYFKSASCTDDIISISIEHSETGLTDICESKRQVELSSQAVKTYLECPALLPIRILKKFLNIKHASNVEAFVKISPTTKIVSMCVQPGFIEQFQLDYFVPFKIHCFVIKHILFKYDIMYDDKPLKCDLTLMDVAYIYAWRPRVAPMRLFYHKSTNENSVANKLEENELKIEVNEPMDLVKKEQETEAIENGIDDESVNLVIDDEMKNDEKENEKTPVDVNVRMETDERPLAIDGECKTDQMTTDQRTTDEVIKADVGRLNLQPKNINICNDDGVLAKKKPVKPKKNITSTPRKYTKKAHKASLNENVLKMMPIKSEPVSIDEFTQRLKSVENAYAQQTEPMAQRIKVENAYSNHSQNHQPSMYTTFNYNPYQNLAQSGFSAFSPLVNQLMYAQQFQMAAEKLKNQTTTNSQHQQHPNQQQQHQQYAHSLYLQNLAQTFLQNQLKGHHQQQPAVPVDYHGKPVINQFDYISNARPGDNNIQATQTTEFVQFEGRNAKSNDAAISLKETQMQILESCNLVND